MKLLRFFLPLFCLFAFLQPAQATHIVGGELELVHIEGNRYLLSLILYSDDINIEDPAAIDPNATVHIWQKSNNSRIRSITLPKVSHTQVPYTNPDCVIPQLSTSKVVYSAEITLEDTVFTQPEGYYINYERCCRNGVISNIRNPYVKGQAFYLEFPPVVKEGAPFINSSPSLFPPLSDFARLGYPFYFDFSGTDADGDSLVYSLVTPLAGSSSPQPGHIVPPPRPGPYDEVLWAHGYSLENVVPGTPPLYIDQNGLIRVTPTQTGLFVFSVMAEEYRDGEKIGEVRRDFQMLVYDYEGSDHPPVLQAQKPGSEAFYENEVLLTEKDFSDFENNRCLTLQVSDQDVDAEGQVVNGEEPIEFKVIPVNYSDHSSGNYLSISKGSVDRNNRILSLELCLPLCPPMADGNYIFDVVAYDDACATPLTDTLRVTVDTSLGLRNKSPQTTTSVTTSASDNATLFYELGESIVFDVNGYDPDHDRLTLTAAGDGFLPEEYGMSFTPLEGAGPLQGTFRWETSCENINLQARNYFTLFFITEDEDVCDQASADTVTVNLALSPPPNAAPELAIIGLNDYLIEITPDSSLALEVKALDPNTADTLTLRLDSLVTASGAPLPFEWQDARAGGGEVSSLLKIIPDCNVFTGGATETYATFYFSVHDNPCYTQTQDTLSLRLRLIEEEISFSDITFPNVFTPNGDGINDSFTILGLPEDVCYNKLTAIRILNRWGQVLYETDDRHFSWDGSGHPAGVYYYELNYTNFSFRSALSLIREDESGDSMQ
ncbi:gliding motility-associated C-terminal domain-containing protein [Nafulsella turpanensis]|uniref:gliding motility-associated C-terminal domain-containing protein n=1 Tax=Nafulsella turpanensis TaxID=1265690 RepID=UPI00135F142A|nr:gliding motility-associated C-terminal domain-containing protein [Nafulsella turpanensis]